MHENNNTMLESIPCLRRYARALTGNHRLADRVVQQCIDCAVDLQQLVKEDHADAAAQKLWLFSIFHNIYNEFINEQETLYERLNYNLSDTGMFAGDPHSHRDLDEYHRALMQLPLLQQQIFLLVSLERFSYEQVAEIIKMPLGAVLSLLHTARQTIADKVYPLQEPQAIDTVDDNAGRLKDMDAAESAHNKELEIEDQLEDHLEKML
jgi:RNA polymerase sigma-70 factor (ECF subfamily)